MLTEYSSIKRGRMKRATSCSRLTLPVVASSYGSSSQDDKRESKKRRSESEMREEVDPAEDIRCWRPRDLATTRKRPPLHSSGIEFSQSPSIVAFPSSFWSIHRRCAPPDVGRTPRQLLWCCRLALAPPWAGPVPL